MRAPVVSSVGFLGVALLAYLGGPSARADDLTVDTVLDRYATTSDVLRGKRVKLRTETVLSGDTRPPKFDFRNAEVDLVNADDRIKGILTLKQYDLRASKLGTAEVSEIHCDLGKKLEFPRASPESKRIKVNPLTVNRKARGLGDLLFDLDHSAAALYGYLDPGSGLSIADVFRQNRPKSVDRVTLSGRPLIRLTAQSKWGTATGYFDPNLGYCLHQYELVKSPDSLLVEADNTPDQNKDRRVKDQPPLKSHPIYPSGTRNSLTYTIVVARVAELKGRPCVSEFTCTERHGLGNGKSFAYTHRSTVESVTEAGADPFAIETEVPEGTHVYVHDRRDSPIEYEWRNGEVVKSSDATFINNVRARFSRGGWWSWGAVLLAVAAAGAAAAAVFVRRRSQTGA